MKIVTNESVVVQSWIKCLFMDLKRTRKARERKRSLSWIEKRMSIDVLAKMMIKSQQNSNFTTGSETEKRKQMILRWWWKWRLNSIVVIVLGSFVVVYSDEDERKSLLEGSFEVFECANEFSLNKAGRAEHKRE